MAKVTGVGGIFLRARDPEALGAWYRRHLGLPYDNGFAQLHWSDDTGPNPSTIWCAFDADTTYFGAMTQQVMINFRVDDLDGLRRRGERTFRMDRGLRRQSHRVVGARGGLGRELNA